MDPLSTSISSAFGLLATFLQERRERKEAQEQATVRDYTEWLRRREHTEALVMLESNHQLSQAIQHLLMTGHDELLERFDHLEAMLNLILGSTTEWGELARSIDPNAGLSDQALDILRWLDGTGATMAIAVETRSGTFLIPREGGGNYAPDDQRFFPNDLASLVGLGLLILGYGSQGSANYTITRAAVALVKSLPDPAEVATNNPA